MIFSPFKSTTESQNQYIVCEPVGNSVLRVGDSEGDSVPIVGDSVRNVEDSVEQVGGVVGLGLEILW